MTVQDIEVMTARGRVPGMEKPESEVAIAWTLAHLDEYPTIEYNFRLGPGVDPGPSYPKESRELNILLTQKRADILARRPGQAAIVEVKLRVDLGAMGQLIGYRALYLEQFGRGENVQLIAAGRFVDDQVRSLLLEQGIMVEIFPQP